MLTKLKPESEFSRNVLIVFSGTLVAQIVPFIASPILTRIYSPDIFGVFALIISIVSIFSMIASGRYEMAIVIAEKHELNKILKICFSLIIFFVGILLFSMFFITETTLKQIHLSQLYELTYLIPIIVLLMAIFQIYYNVLVKNKMFRVLSNNKILLAFSTVVLQIVLGYVFSSNYGLIFGYLFGFVFSLFFLFSMKVINFEDILQTKEILNIAKKYSNFPKYSLPSDFLNVVSNQLPVLLIGSMFSITSLGYYALVNRLLSAPVSLLSSSILDVFKQKATEDFKLYGNCRAIYKNTFYKLLIMSFFPFLLFWIFADDVFGFIFGSEWSTAGKYAQILAPLFFLKFIASPLSYVFIIVQKQKWDFIGQLSLLFVTSLAMYIGYIYSDILLMLKLFALFYSIIYLAYIVLSFILSGESID